ncbi:MAG: hypothetical protein H6978_00405 [Gammaproteobacteria bacterium]|nr:hypothetical protein [Gammaproteobacteria bacterium]
MHQFIEPLGQCNPPRETVIPQMATARPREVFSNVNRAIRGWVGAVIYTCLRARHLGAALRRLGNIKISIALAVQTEKLTARALSGQGWLK